MNYQMITHREMKFDDHSRAYPTEFLTKEGGVSVYKSTIPYTYTQSKIVYFVTSARGDEYGQFDTAQKAMEKHAEVTG